MKKTLYIILNKKNSDQSIYKNTHVFTLNEFVLSDKEKMLCNNLFPDPRKTAIEAESIILKTNNLSVKIIDNLKKRKLFHGIKNLDELLITFLEIKISRLLYLISVIPDYHRYVLIDQKNQSIINSKEDLILTIDKLYSLDKKKDSDFFNKFCNYKFNFYNLILLNIQRKLINRILRRNKKEINFFSDKKAYFIELLKSKIANNKNIILYYSPSKSYLRIFQILLIQFFNSFFKNKTREIGIFLLPKNNLYYDEYSKIFKSSDDFKIECFDKNLSSYFAEQIYSYILNSISYKSYLLNLFKELKIKNSYFHSVRFPDLFSFSRVLSLIKSNVFLISHGSHTVQKNKKLDIISSQILGIGMAYSNEKNINLLSQSKYCDDFLESRGLSFFKISRLINKNIKIPKTKIKNSKTKILIVGTVKPLGARRYYFESSAEFLESISSIYKKLIKDKELFEINVRIRDTKNEINKDILENAFKNKKDLININKGKSIYEEIKNCDCLISFSSTTLEEGLLMSKPVMCFGLPRYNHLKLYENTNIQIRNKYLNKRLKIIEKSLGRKFVFKSSKKRKVNFNL